MFKAIILASALATMAPETVPITFTSDSVYKNEDIINIEYVKHVDYDETFLVDINFHEMNRLGYAIYDNPETDYIDGIKLDDLWVPSDWTLSSIDMSVEHVLKIKTVYTDDYAGMIMSAKDGDWSLLLKNPETILKLVYYGLATISLVFTALMTLFGKKNKAKSAEEISNKVSAATANFEKMADAKVQEAIKSTMVPVIKALVLSKSDKPEDIIAMLDLLSTTNVKEEVNEASEVLKAKLLEKTLESKAKLEQAKADVHKIAKNTVEDVIDNLKL